MAMAIDQSGASAGGDIVAGNKVVIQTANRATKIELLMERLAAEIEEKQQVREVIDALQFFYLRRATDDVVGLEAKLIKAGRDDELLLAYEKKEVFVKALERYALYASAQRIFALLLAKAEYEFNSFIKPAVPTGSIVQINLLIDVRIVVPILSECSIGPIEVDHCFIMGMVYWLAEQCFIRWH